MHSPESSPQNGGDMNQKDDINKKLNAQLERIKESTGYKRGIDMRQAMERRYTVPDSKEFLAKQKDKEVFHEAEPMSQQSPTKKSPKNKDLTKLLKREPVRYFNEVAEPHEEANDSQKKLEGF